MSPKQRTRVLLISLTGSLSLVATLFVIIREPAASGYEISVYDGFPEYFWVLLVPAILSLFGAMIVGNPISRRDIFVLIPSAFTSLVSIMVLLLVPYFRGYALYGAGDTFTHLGFVKDILENGHTPTQDVYPGIHVLAVALSFVSSASPIQSTFFWPPLFVLLLLLGTFLLVRHLGSSTAALLACALLIIPVLGSEATRESILPSFDAFCLLPFELFFLFRSQRSMAHTIAFVIVLAALTFLHVEASLFLLVFLVVILLVSRYVSQFAEVAFSPKAKFDATAPARRRYVTAIILLAVFFVAFYSSLTAFGSTVRTVYANLTSSLLEGPIVTHGPLQTTGALDILILVIRLFGGALVYVGLAVGIALLTIAKAATNRKRVTPVGILQASMLLACLALSLIFLLYGLIIGYSFTRMLKYPFLMSAVILGAYLASPLAATPFLAVSVVERRPRRRTRLQARDASTETTRWNNRSIVAVFVVATAIISVFNAYPDPSTRGFSFQTTNADFSGMRFLLTLRDERTPIAELLPLSRQTRFAQALYGVEAIVVGLRDQYDPSVLPPAHFGYDQGEFLGAAYRSNTYLVLSSLSLMYYPDLYVAAQSAWRYSPSDFQRLTRDPTVNWIYDNGGIQVLVVTGGGQ